MSPLDTTPTGESAPSRPPNLDARDVRKEYGRVVALDGVSLRVSSGECVALVGESGSGKTTLLRTFNRLVEPDGGTVRVGDRNVEGWDPVQLRRRMGYVQQDGGLLPHWTVARNAALVPRLQGTENADELASSALERVGLDPEEFGPRWPRELSGGQRQRVAIARALAAGPGVILLDEPFGALDAITRAELQESFRDLRADLEATTLLVTHDLREALYLADRIAVMRRGRLEQVDTGEGLRAHPDTPYVRALLDRAGVGTT